MTSKERWKLLLPIGLLGALTVTIGFAAEPVFQLATRAAEQLVDREGYIRALLVIAFVLLTAPVAAHMIARAAYSVGTPLWKGTIADELRDQHQPPAGLETGEGSAVSSGSPPPVEGEGTH